MRVFDGAQFLVWRYYNSSEELEFIDEINQTEEREQMGEIAQFLMRGKFNARFSKNGPNYDVVLLVTVIEEGIILNVLKHKPLSEMWDLKWILLSNWSIKKLWLIVCHSVAISSILYIKSC